VNRRRPGTGVQAARMSGPASTGGRWPGPQCGDGFTQPSRPGWVIRALDHQNLAAHSMINRRGAALARSAISDLGRNPLHPEPAAIMGDGHGCTSTEEPRHRQPAGWRRLPAGRPDRQGQAVPHRASKPGYPLDGKAARLDAGLVSDFGFGMQPPRCEILRDHRSAAQTRAVPWSWWTCAREQPGPPSAGCRAVNYLGLTGSDPLQG